MPKPLSLASAPDEDRSAASSAPARLRLAALLALGLALSLIATWAALTGDYEIGSGLREIMLQLQIALFVSIGIQALALTWTVVARVDAMPARVGFYVLVLATLAFLVLAQPFWIFYLELAVVLTFGAVALLAVFGPRLARLLPSGLLRFGDIALFNLCAILLVSEGALRIWHAVRPSPLLAPTDSSTLARLDRYRLEPGSLYLGARVNSKGFYDEEFSFENETRTRVACIGDSFNVGVVPQELHYTSVAERSAPQLRVDNYGIGGIGPSEYLLLLKRDVLPTKPDAVVISLFVGNDIAEAGKGRVGHRTLRSFFDRGNVRLYLLPRRLLALAREQRAREGGAIAEVQGANSDLVSGLDAIRKQFPWIEDPAKEKPTFGEVNFLAETTRRAKTVRPSERAHYARLEEDLEEMKLLCKDTKLFVVLQAAEWQVEDELWQSIIAKAGAGAKLDRDAPQRLTREILDKLGLPYLDALETLRAAPPLPDGKRHVFHLRDTHYNARGNRIVGEAFGRWLSTVLDR